MKIANLSPRDAKALARIHEKVIINIIWEKRCWSEKEYCDLFNLKTTHGFKIIQNHEMIAFIVMQIVENTAEILYLATVPDYQRQGVAQKLWDYCCGVLKKKGVKTLFLDVCTKNEAAIAFYRKNNFSCITLRKNYYLGKNGETYDAAVYSQSNKDE